MSTSARRRRPPSAALAGLATPRGAARPGRRVRGGTAALLLVLVTLVVVPPAAVAQPDPPEVELTLSAVTGVLGPGIVPPGEDPDPAAPSPIPDELRLRVLVANTSPEPVDLLRVVTEVYPAVSDRPALHAAFEGDLPSEPLHVHDIAVRDGAALAPGGVAGVEDAFVRDEVDWADDPGGVHPVRVAVVRGTTVLAELVTAVVWVATPPAAPLLTSVVWPLNEPPWRTAGGAYPANVDRAVQPGGRIDRLVAALERNGASGVTLAPTAHLLEDLEDRRDGFVTLERQDGGPLERRTAEPDGQSAMLAEDVLGRLRGVAAASEPEPVAGDYADADLTALRRTAPPADALAAEAAVDGRRRLQRLLGQAVDASVHLVPGPTSPDTLDLIPGEVALVGADAVVGTTGAGAQPSDGVRTLRTPAGRLLDVLVADGPVSTALGQPDLAAGPLAAVQRFVAETAQHWLAAPETSDRTLLVLPDPDWDAPPEVLDGALAALETAVWLAPTAPSALASSGRRVTAEVTLTEPEDPTLPGALASDLTTATADLAAIRGALPEDQGTIDGRSAAELHDQLVRASSRWLRDGGDDEALLLVRDVQRTVDAAFGTVSVVASGVTLTSDTGQIPVTVQRTRGGPITVVVEVTSQGRLLWPEGRRSEPVVLDEDGSTTVTFATQALSTGTFPVTVRVTDPDGVRELQRTDLSVRSTAISGPALAIIGAIIVLLLVIGALRRRDPRPPALTVVGDRRDREVSEPPAPLT